MGEQMSPLFLVRKVFMINLPEDFKLRMKEELGEEYLDFIGSYDNESIAGIRLNPLKAKKEDFEKENPFDCKPIDWCATGYYYRKETRPGRHPWHEAGMYYIQEPSAMSAAEELEVKPGDMVLDLCAAPGGKTTQLAGKMNGVGLLVANEIHPQRAKILSQNIERMGIKNALVLNEDSFSLAKHFPNMFDKILCDAPCSGEGMFRRDEIARTEWSMENVIMCADRQREILANVMVMLKAGGQFVYSTCTFSREENEKNVEWLLENYKELELEKMLRIWPHKQKGEGHFVAVFHKNREKEDCDFKLEKTTPLKEKLYREWEKSVLKAPLEGHSLLFGNNLYLVPNNLPKLKGLKVLRTGLQLGTLDKKIFKPSHALAMALHPSDVKQFVSFHADSKEILGYLRGETIPCSTELKGWVLVCVDEMSIGWGKASSGMIKNHYPKGLRILWKD